MVGQVHMGRYEIQRLLGEGGMGRVYLARQLDLGRQVVVKVMHDHIAADPKFCERFQRETLVMARFQHPYAVSLYDASLNGAEGPCIVMEHIKGITLDVLLQRNGRLTPSRAGRLLGQLCEVLQAAHQLGIIHRDLKPANLMIVDPDTPYEMVKVMDFGLAKLLEPDPAKQAISNAEFAVGTPGYMCPEQARGEDMDHRGDLYSVGIMFYELLTGRLPFTGDVTMDVLIAHATETPPTFDELGVNDLVSPEIEAVILSCLEKDAKDRPSSGRELAELYEKALFAENAIAHDVVPAATETASLGTSSSSSPTPLESPAVAGLARRSSRDEPEPLNLIKTLSAWMPEQVAACKLKGFVADKGGEVFDTRPGFIHVRMGKTSVYSFPKSTSFSFFGLGKKASFVDLELQLEKADGKTNNHIVISVLLRPSDQSVANVEAWQARCEEIFCDLRAYLMGNNGLAM